MAPENNFNQTALCRDNGLALESSLPHHSSASGDWEEHSVRFFFIE